MSVTVTARAAARRGARARTGGAREGTEILEVRVGPGWTELAFILRVDDDRRWPDMVSDRNRPRDETRALHPCQDGDQIQPRRPASTPAWKRFAAPRRAIS